ncbi:MAG: triphosphoribosyl-dephospho-CoA synthase [Candidatus Izimaplasma sp.]|nr:triphosphoribosyl-dephospho-CoA synthase [Candidatus Izimaplasma bacterium]
MITSDSILDARENRAKKISSFLNNNKKIVCIKANLPGNNKTNYLAHLIINSFSLRQLDLNIIHSTYYESHDGPYYLLEIESEVLEEVKNQMIVFEEAFSLGRFLDIDVYSEVGQLSRKSKRKCYLCNDIAYNCIRNKKHTVEEVYQFVKSKTLDYYKEILFNYINESIELELNLDPKFGLVTRKSHGSHEDMNYKIMINAKNVIIPYFIDMFCETIRSNEALDLILKKSKEVGLKAEKAMYKETNGVNAYKGLIFHLGLFVTAYGYVISRNTNKSLLEIVKQLAVVFFYKKADDNSFGSYAMERYNITGAKGEALSGYLHVRSALKCLVDFSEDSLIKTLVYLIIEIEDTNLLKRAGSLELYEETKKRFTELELNTQDIKNLTNYCIEHNLSFGGSADLLIVTIFIKKLMVICDKINL